MPLRFYISSPSKQQQRIGVTPWEGLVYEFRVFKEAAFPRSREGLGGPLLNPAALKAVPFSDGTLTSPRPKGGLEES